MLVQRVENHQERIATLMICSCYVQINTLITREGMCIYVMRCVGIKVMCMGHILVRFFQLYFFIVKYCNARDICLHAILHL